MIERRGLIGTGLGIVVALLLSTPAPALAAKGDLEYISRDDAGLAGNDDSAVPAISDDGNLVAFWSFSSNFVPGASGGQVFLRDVSTGTIFLISRASLAQGNTPANANSDEPDITGDGRFVVYHSNATNLSPLANTSGQTRIFMRDRTTNVTSLVSIKNDGVSTAGGVDPAVSTDGRFVAYESGSNDVGDVNAAGTDDIIVRDVQAGTNETASQAGGVAGDDDSIEASISDDGRFVAFSSKANNLSTLDDNAVRNVFVRDMQTGTTTLVSRQSASAGGAGANGFSESPVISGNGRFVAFTSEAANLGAVGGVAQVFVRDLQTNTTTLISRQSDADGGAIDDKPSTFPSSGDLSISDDGRYVVFDSIGTNLSTQDQDGFSEPYVRDTVAGTTTLVGQQSAADGGLGANGNTIYQSEISRDGRWIAFDSVAGNLSASDLDATDDVFRLDFLGPPPAGSGDTTGPDLGLRKKGKAKAGKTLKIVVTSDEAATVEAAATAKAGRKRVTFKGASGSVAAGGSVTLKLKLAKRPARLLSKAGKGKAKVTVTATDASGNASSDPLKVKLK